MNKDQKIIRRLAAQYYEYAVSDENLRNMSMHRAVNDLKAPRPVVLIDEIPWHEMDIDDELTLQCEDGFFRGIELFLRREIYRWNRLRGDMVLRPYISVPKVIWSTGIGLESIEKENQEGAKSHTYVNQLKTDEDINKLHNEVITYEEQETMQNYERTAEIIAGVAPIKICGEGAGWVASCKTIDDLVRLMGLDTFFYEFIDRPDFMHKIIGRVTDIYMDKIRQYDELGLFEGNSYYNHCTAALTNDLKPDLTHVRAKDVWGRGLAQIFASFSPEMLYEFDIAYAVRALAPFGLVYYGCCEPLDKKLDVVKKIPNLRKISITPWADIDNAADIIRGDYVLAVKPNPSQLATAKLDEDSVKKEMGRILAAIKKNGCSADIVLKDITTVHGDPENLFKWHDIAMEMVNDYYT